MMQAVRVAIVVLACVGCQASLVPPSQQGTATQNCLAICRAHYTGQNYLDCADRCAR